MADPAAGAELKVKRTADYDDVVRDYRKREIGMPDMGYQFNRDCGRAIEALMAKAATKTIVFAFRSVCEQKSPRA